MISVFLSTSKDKLKAEKFSYGAKSDDLLTSRFASAMTDLLEGNYSNASQAFSGILNENSGLSDAAIGLALSLLYIEKYEEAEDVLNRNAASGNMHVLLVKAMIKMEQEKLKEAEEILRMIISKNQAEVFALLLISVAYDIEGRYEETAELMEKAEELEPENADIKNMLASAYASGGLLDKAIGKYEESIRLKDNESEPWVRLFEIYYDKGENTHAAYCLNSILNFDENNVEVYTMLGTLYKEMNEHEKAAECFKKARSIRSGISR